MLFVSLILSLLSWNLRSCWVANEVVSAENVMMDLAWDTEATLYTSRNRQNPEYVDLEC